MQLCKVTLAFVSWVFSVSAHAGILVTVHDDFKVIQYERTGNKVKLAYLPDPSKYKVKITFEGEYFDGASEKLPFENSFLEFEFLDDRLLKAFKLREGEKRLPRYVQVATITGVEVGPETWRERRGVVVESGRHELIRFMSGWYSGKLLNYQECLRAFLKMFPNFIPASLEEILISQYVDERSGEAMTEDFLADVLPQYDLMQDEDLSIFMKRIDSISEFNSEFKKGNRYLIVGDFLQKAYASDPDQYPDAPEIIRKLYEHAVAAGVLSGHVRLADFIFVSLPSLSKDRNPSETELKDLQKKRRKEMIEYFYHVYASSGQYDKGLATGNTATLVFSKGESDPSGWGMSLPFQLTLNLEEDVLQWVDFVDRLSQDHVAVCSKLKEPRGNPAAIEARIERKKPFQVNITAEGFVDLLEKASILIQDKCVLEAN